MTSLPEPLLPHDLPTDPVSGPLAVSGEEKEKKKKKKKRGSRGVETLFRTSLEGHLKLSEMADQKANLMISINTILVSITLSPFVQGIEGSQAYLVPSVLLVAVCLVTIVAALLATKPSLRAKPDPERKLDLLFFNDYSHLSRVEYRRQMNALLENDADLYNGLIDNIYAQGRVLTRKYRLLQFAYGFFMIGFSSVVVVALLMLLMNQ